MAYSGLGTYMGGGLPNVDDVWIPHTEDPSLYVPTAPQAPVVQPGVIGSINPFMAKLGAALMSPQGKKALAIGANTANILGRTKNWQKPLAQYMAGIAGQGAVAQQTGGTTAPADNRSVLEQMRNPAAQQAQPNQPAQTQAQQVQPLVILKDKNNNNIPDNLEVQKTLSSLLSGGPAFSIDQGLSDFQGGLGANVGTPESTAAPTYVQNSNEGMTDQTALELLAATIGPEAAIKLALEKAGRIAPTMQAEAALMEADIKNRMFEPMLAKTRSEILKNRADAAKTNFEMSPEYVTQRGAISGAEEKAKEEAKAAVVRQAYERVVKDSASIPVYEPTLRAQGFTNYGQLWLALGKNAPEVVSAAMRATAEKASAGIAGTSLQKSALATLVQTVTTRLSQLNKLEVPLATTDPGYDVQRSRFLTGAAMPATEALITEKNNLQQVHGVAVKALSSMGGAGSSNSGAVKTKYTPRAIVVNGFKVPAKSTYRINADGTVDVKRGGK